jgi:prophage regulatory protein
MVQKLLNVNEVAERLGVCRASVYAFARRDDFPKQIKLGRCSRWSEDEVVAWVESAPRGAYGASEN